MNIIKIPVENLKEGMVIRGIDKKWLKLPFFNKPLDNIPERIETLKKYGIQYVFVEDNNNKDTNNKNLNKNIKKVDPQIKTTIDKKEILQLKRIKELHIEHKEAIKNIFLDVRAGKSLSSPPLKKIVKTYLDYYLKKPELLLNIIRLKDFDRYIYIHSLNVCVLSIIVGSRMGFDVENLNCLGLGGLLHDIGKMKIPETILNKKGELTEKENELLKKHPVYSYAIIKDSLDISLDTKKCVLQHHEYIDGTGYPLGLTDKSITKHAKIVSIVNFYDYLTSSTPNKDALIPQEAIKKIIDVAGTKFDKLYVHFFIDTLGIYPVGTLVLLDSGELAVVFQINRRDMTRPLVLIISDNNQNMIPPYPFNLNSYNLVTKKPYKSIKKALEKSDYNLDTNKLIDNFIATCL